MARKKRETERTFKVGDRVRVREWDDMVREFGTCADGNINVSPIFVGTMKQYCGKIAKIKDVTERIYRLDLDKGKWNFAEESLELVKDSPEESPKPTFKVGDKVKIRTWESMEAEFGLDRDGDIKCTPCFTKGMKCYCGEYATVTNTYSSENNSFQTDSGGTWWFSVDSIESVEEAPEEKQPEEHDRFYAQLRKPIPSFKLSDREYDDEDDLRKMLTLEEAQTILYARCHCYGTQCDNCFLNNVDCDEYAKAAALYFEAHPQNPPKEEEQPKPKFPQPKKGILSKEFKNTQDFEENATSDDVEIVLTAWNTCYGTDCDECCIRQMFKNPSTTCREIAKVAYEKYQDATERPAPKATKTEHPTTCKHCESCKQFKDIAGYAYCSYFHNFTNRDGYCHEYKEREER